MRTVPGDHFATGVFAQALPGELLSKHTCLECGHRSATWAGFRAHRGACPGHQTDASAPAGWDAVLTEDDLDRLAALYEQLHAGDAGATRRRRRREMAVVEVLVAEAGDGAARVWLDYDDVTGLATALRLQNATGYPVDVSVTRPDKGRTYGRAGVVGDATVAIPQGVAGRWVMTFDPETGRPIVPAEFGLRVV